VRKEKNKNKSLCGLPLENGEIKKIKKMLWHQLCFYIRLLTRNVPSKKHGWCQTIFE
jgi:hypothetical protein